MFKRLPITLGVMTIIGATFLFAPKVHADLTIMPLRVQFADRERTAELTLANATNVTNTYRLELINNKMNEDGSYTPLTEPLNPIFQPEKAIVVSPRQVTIPPGQQQRVRLSLRRPADLPDGEYRAHLLMKKMDNPAAVDVPSEEGIAAVLNVNVGFSIPIIVQQGVPNVKAGLTDIKIVPPAKAGRAPQLHTYLTREGSAHSLNGRVLVFWTPPGGTEEQIGIANNINVFPEVSRRLVKVNLNSSRPITGGSMRIAFETMEGVLQTQAVMPLQ